MASLKACAKNKSFQDLSSAQLKVSDHLNFFRFAPVVDGYFLPGMWYYVICRNRLDPLQGKPVKKIDHFISLSCMFGLQVRVDSSRWYRSGTLTQDPSHYGPSSTVIQVTLDHRLWFRLLRTNAPLAAVLKYNFLGSLDIYFNGTLTLLIIGFAFVAVLTSSLIC